MTSLLLGDLNDYIQPAVACIKPNAPGDHASTEKEPESPVVINLNDCLACSGCITSAEAVLITQQTHQQLYDALAYNAKFPVGSPQRRIIIVSISAASQAALALHFRMEPIVVWRKLVYFFKNIVGGADTGTKSDILVVDSTFGFSLALREAAGEFIQWHQNDGNKNQPMFTSECPGWICYAEKRQANLLGQICTVRSPQQILGALFKDQNFKDEILGWVNSVFHVSVQPCFDKKLEASRSDFRIKSKKEGNNGMSLEESEVDCVISTSELFTILQERIPEGDFINLPEELLDSPFAMFNSESLKLWRHEGSSAGGYLTYILRRSALELFNIRLADNLHEDPHLSIERHRSNVDYTEYTLRDNQGEVLLRFAAIYGFRNIQTFVQKTRQRRAPIYHYVEVMACPGACLFGGGQLKELSTGATKSQQESHRNHMEELYADGMKPPLDLPHVDRIWRWILENHDRRQSILHTSYRPVEGSDHKRPGINVSW